MSAEELREHAEAMAAFAPSTPNQSGICHECNRMYDVPVVEPIPDDPGMANFFCPHCGDHFARWEF